MSKNRHRMAVAAHLLLENERGEVLFLRRANTSYADGEWSVPAGHVDVGETLIEACVRETAEELAIDLTSSDVRPVLVQHKRDSDGEERIDFFFAASLPKGQTPVIGEPDKCDALGWALLALRQSHWSLMSARRPPSSLSGRTPFSPISDSAARITRGAGNQPSPDQHSQPQHERLECVHG